VEHGETGLDRHDHAGEELMDLELDRPAGAPNRPGFGAYSKSVREMLDDTRRPIRRNGGGTVAGN
jgi:hypothetical protein